MQAYTRIVSLILDKLLAWQFVDIFIKFWKFPIFTIVKNELLF